MKLLFVCATEMEMAPLKAELVGRPAVELLVSGVGLVASSCSVSRFLASHPGEIRVVINFGVAGAYVGSGAGLLDICLAEKEVLGDFGLCFNGRIEPFKQEKMTAPDSFSLAFPVLQRAEEIFTKKTIPFKKGIFVTVNCASATAARGDFLCRSHGALAENMEGAAIAGACRGEGIPLVEVRCISNMVEDRNTKTWCLADACEKSAGVAACLADSLFE